MIRKTLLICLLLCSYSISYSQHNISGNIIDSIGAPIDAAVITFLDAKTDAVLDQIITDYDGKYNTSIDKDSIQLYISCLGYKQYISKPFTITKDTILQDIQLRFENFVLGDVVVIGEKQTPSIRIENGKMIYTLKNSSTTAGSSALEVLKKTPGVIVDGGNNISIGGKNSVLVILNGKQTYMQREEMITLLKSTPSSSVTSVEVIHNPSAQYDAEGSGGIININMAKKRVNALSINNGISYWDNLRQNTEEYELNANHLLGGRVDVNTVFGPGQTITTTEIRDAASMNLEQVLYAQNNYYEQRGNRYSGNLYYIATPKEGVKYTTDLNYTWFDGGSGNMQPNVYKSPEGDILHENLYRSINGRDIHIFALSHDQEHPLWGGALKSGLKYANVDADNSFRFYNVYSENNEQIDENQSNNFGYKEGIMSAYLLYATTLSDKVSMEAGIRGEYAQSDGTLYTVSGTSNETNKNNYFDLFPSLSLNYQINENNTLNLSYGKRIDRPAYQDLNPFEYLLDELSYWKGNPFLTPQKTHNISAAYSHKRTALTASYSYLKNYKAQITDTLSVNKVIMTPRNIGKQQRFSLTLYQGINIARWWETNLNLIGYYVNNDIAFDQYRHFDLDGFAGIFTVHNTIHLPFQIKMELNGMYATKRLGAANERLKPTGFVDIGFNKSFDNKRWTVNLAMSDLFWTNRWDNYSSFDGLQLWNWGKSESRQIKLNVTYRFGIQKSSSHSSSLNEIDRL